MNSAKRSAGNLLQPHDRARLVERPAPAEHPLHEARLGPGEDIPDLTLVLDGRAQRVLDASAVEGADRLELVERHGETAAARLGDAAGQREHLLGDARHVPVRADRRERQGQLAAAVVVRLDAHLVADGAEHVAQPPAGPVEARLDRQQRARVALEERDVRAVAADGDVDRERAAAFRAAQRLPHERGLAVAARRDQEDLLPGEQIAREPIELRFAVDERRGRDDFAVDEWVMHSEQLLVLGSRF